MVKITFPNGSYYVKEKDFTSTLFQFSTCSIDEKLTGLDKLTSGGERDFATMIWDQIAEVAKHSI